VQKNRIFALLDFGVIVLCSFLHFGHFPGHSSESIIDMNNSLLVDRSHWVDEQWKRSVTMPCPNFGDIAICSF
jgi:hypothetical protein